MSYIARFLKQHNNRTDCRFKKLHMRPESLDGVGFLEASIMQNSTFDADINKDKE